jgi:hypothetical protein
MRPHSRGATLLSSLHSDNTARYGCKQSAEYRAPKLVKAENISEKFLH